MANPTSRAAWYRIHFGDETYQVYAPADTVAYRLFLKYLEDPTRSLPEWIRKTPKPGGSTK